MDGFVLEQKIVDDSAIMNNGSEIQDMKDITPTDPGEFMYSEVSTA